MARNYPTTHQHEPLRAPSGWSLEEKRLVQQVDDLIGNLYSRFNRLRVDDLSQEAKDAIFAIITADRLDVDEIMGGSAFIDKIESRHVKANAIKTEHIGPLDAELIATSSTGQQLVVTFSNGTILDKNNISTTATAKISENGVDITDDVPVEAFHWERISENTTADAAWNAAHTGVKSVTIESADVDFKCVFRCTVDEIAMRVSVSYENGIVTITDGTNDLASDFVFDPDTGELEYVGGGDYVFVDGCLLSTTATSRLSVDITASNLKTSFINIFREGIEIYGSGYLRFLTDGEIDMQAGSLFNLRAGSGTNSIGLSNNEANGYMQWAGNADPSLAPFSVKRDGSIKATKLSLGNSQITNVTNSYAQHFYDNADADTPAKFSIYIPPGTGSVASVKISFKAEKFRAYSKAASNGGGFNVEIGGSRTDTGNADGPGTHYHYMYHTHSLTIGAHGHSINYGIYEAAAPAAELVLKVDGTTKGTYTASGATEVEIKDQLSKTGGIITRGWHEIRIEVDDISRIVANIFVQTVVSTVEGTM